MTSRHFILAILALSISSTTSFAPTPNFITSKASVVSCRQFESPTQLFSTEQEEEELLDVPQDMNPDNPDLPLIKGNFDWDAKFKDDDDWITENVPGKGSLNEVELAAQVTALAKLEAGWRKKRQIQDYDAAQNIGFSKKAELLNGRSAMFFIVVGLLTEYWTGIDMPGQVEEMLRVTGVLGFQG